MAPLIREIIVLFKELSAINVLGMFAFLLFCELLMESGKMLIKMIKK